MKQRLLVSSLLVILIGTSGCALFRDPMMMEQLFAAKEEAQGIRTDLASIVDKLGLTQDLTQKTETFTEVLASLNDMTLTNEQIDTVNRHIEATYNYRSKMSTSRGNEAEYRDAEDDFRASLERVIYWRDKFKTPK